MFIVPSVTVGAEDKEVLLVGSHLDTVIEGGWLDGALGVSTAMHVVEQMAGPQGADPRIGLVVFRDEEGVRFNSGLFGSRVVAGRRPIWMPAIETEREFGMLCPIASVV
jgi:Iap family predicted aminopeptidase